ncbi:MAG: Rieske (2Fe-2S) protein [Haloferacaceae archaeon]
MADGATITDREAVTETGSHLFTVEDPFTNEREAILVPCDEDPGVRGWINDCPHQSQRLDTGQGVALRDGEIVCPRHGSLFDACSGACDNGPAAGTTLSAVEVGVDDGAVVLTDDDYVYLRDGGVDDDEPGSTSHISL